MKSEEKSQLAAMYYLTTKKPNRYKLQMNILVDSANFLLLEYGKIIANLSITEEL